MKSLLKAYFAYAEDPAQTVRALVEQRHFKAAFLGYAVAALCWVCFFWIGDDLSAWGFIWRFLFFWLLEVSLGYLWAALSGLFLNFFANGNGPSALFIALGLSGFVQSILLCFALLASAAPWLGPLSILVFVVCLLLRFCFAVLNTARAVNVGLGKALGALCFALVPAAAAGCLMVGCMVLLVGLAS